MEGRFHRWYPTRNTVRLVLAPALVFIATSLDRGYQTDFWQHLARGRLIVQERAVVSVDRFTFTEAGRDFYDNNWLTQLLYYGVHRIAGLEGVQLVNSLALATTFALLVGLCKKTSGSTAFAGASGVLTFVGLWPTFLIRPQTVSMLLFVALCTMLEAARHRPKLLLWAPPLMALWANVHGGFAVGLALIFASAVGAVCCWWTRRAKVGAAPDAEPQPLPLVACLLASAAATLANPYGWNVYRYAGRLSAVGFARGIEEWLPPSLDSLNGAVLAATLALTAFLAVTSPRRPTAREWCVLACFAVPACLSTRMTVWWFLVSAPVIARLAAGMVPPETAPARRSPFAAVSLATIACVAVLSLPWLETYNPVMGTLRVARRTEADLQAIADQLPQRTSLARVFTRMEWANYLAWSAADRSSVFVEGHVELYPDDVWERYLAVTEARPGWDRVLDGYGVEYLLLDETYHADLVGRVRQSAQWSQRASVGQAVLFARRKPTLPAPEPTVAGTDF